MSVQKHYTAVEECLTFLFPDANNLRFQNLQADNYRNVKPWPDKFTLYKFLISFTITIDKILTIQRFY